MKIIKLASHITLLSLPLIMFSPICSCAQSQQQKDWFEWSIYDDSYEPNVEPIEKHFDDSDSATKSYLSAIKQDNNIFYNDMFLNCRLYFFTEWPESVTPTYFYVKLLDVDVENHRISFDISMNRHENLEEKNQTLIFNFRNIKWEFYEDESVGEKWNTFGWKSMMNKDMEDLSSDDRWTFHGDVYSFLEWFEIHDVWDCNHSKIEEVAVDVVKYQNPWCCRCRSTYFKKITVGD